MIFRAGTCTRISSLSNLSAEREKENPTISRGILEIPRRILESLEIFAVQRPLVVMLSATQSRDSAIAIMKPRNRAMVH